MATVTTLPTAQEVNAVIAQQERIEIEEERKVPGVFYLRTRRRAGERGAQC